MNPQYQDLADRAGRARDLLAWAQVAFGQAAALDSVPAAAAPAGAVMLNIAAPPSDTLRTAVEQANVRLGQAPKGELVKLAEQAVDEAATLTQEIKAAQP